MMNSGFELTNKDKEILIKASANPDINSIRKLEKFLNLIDDDNITINENGIVEVINDDFVDEGYLSDNKFQFSNLMSSYKEPVLLAA